MVEIQKDRVAELESVVASLVERVDTLEKRKPVDNRTLKTVRDRLEDVLDHVYGVNVRPPLVDRVDYPAEVKPSNEDD